MVFSSITFLFYFLPTVLLFYFLVPFRFKNLILLIFSLIFYAWGEPVYIVIMFISCITDYTCAIIIDKYRGHIYSKLALCCSLIVNLGLLALFKYSNFAISVFNNALDSNLSLLDITLPVGISFYTFQTLSYTIDVYRNEVPVQKNIIPFATFVTLFPQLVAGPIVRYCDMYKEIEYRNHSLELFYEGTYRFIIGLSKKVILANNLGAIWYSIKASNYSDLSIGSAWLGIICFTLQIYFDFSGYSDMAIGMGKMFGFNFLENFNFPFISKSITEFWRKWHISLGVWFRDYVYIPLGGNRCSKSRWIFNIFVVWFLTGLWHGASFNFILWGLYFGIILMLEKLFLLDILKKIPNFMNHIYVMVLVIISFVLFDIDTLTGVSHYLGAMFNFDLNFIDREFFYYLVPNLLLLSVSIVCSTPVFKYILDRNIYIRTIVLIFGFLISTAFLVDASFNPFLYFRF